MKIFHIPNDIQKLGNGIIDVAVYLACLQSKLGHKFMSSLEEETMKIYWRNGGQSYPTKPR